MPKYVRLTSLTEEGRKHVEESSDRTAKIRELAEETGGSIEDVFLTFGKCDFVTIAEFPDDQSYAEFALKAAQGGKYESHTLKAIEEEDYLAIIDRLQ